MSKARGEEAPGQGAATYCSAQRRWEKRKWGMEPGERTFEQWQHGQRRVPRRAR